MKNIAACFLCSFLVSLASVSAAEDWNPVSAGPVTAWTAPLCEKGKIVVQPFFFYNRTRGTFDAEGDYNSLAPGDKKEQYIEQLFVQYGLTEKLELAGQIAYQENYAREAGRSAYDQGFTDSFVFLRACLLEETEWLPHLAALVQLKLPTGKYQKADPDKLGTDLMGSSTGGGSYDRGIGLNLTKKIKPFVLHADAIYSFPLKAKVDGIRTEYGQYLNFDLGLEYFFGNGFNLMIEGNGLVQGDRKENGQLLPATDMKSFVVSPGIGWSNDTIQTLLAYQRVVAGTSADANDSVVLTFVYTF